MMKIDCASYPLLGGLDRETLTGQIYGDSFRAAGKWFGFAAPPLRPSPE